MTHRGAVADAPPSRAPLVVIAFVAGLLGGLAGGVLMSRSSGSEPPASAPIPVGERAALEALTRELAALRAEWAQRPVADAAPAPLVKAAADDASSDGAVERLAAVLAQRVASGTPGGFTTTEREPLVDDRVDPVPRSARQAELAAALHAELEADEPGTVKRRYTLWTERQVIDRFGKPDEIDLSQSEGTVHWRYEVSEDESLVFVYHDGLVIGCW